MITTIGNYGLQEKSHRSVIADRAAGTFVN